MTEIVDQYGRPLRREVLKREVAGPSLTGVRSPIAGYPADGMNPVRLAELLREAAEGEPLRYFELAELIEERDLHYAGVLAARKRAVSQIEITVEAASDDKADVDRADMVRDWLRRDELADEMFDVLDAVGKGVSFTEIIWDSSEGQWRPERLEWRDPRWFTFDRRDLRTPLLRGGEDMAAQGSGMFAGTGNGNATPLPAFKFIFAQLKAKSGLPVRSGLARLAAWSWMFKAFTQRDWAIFSQTYGQPVRLGKYHEGATKEDKETLFRAVANIAGDCAAIIPNSMVMDFVESKNVGAGSDLYERRADWLDRQVSKAVLGQTGTTDSKQGGLGDGGNRVHNDVREDIETADCRAVAAVINRDLIRPWMDLEYGPQKLYPRVVIARPKQEDLKQLTDSLKELVPLGLRVQQSEVRDKLGLSDPEDDADVLRAPAASSGIVPDLPIASAPLEAPSLHAEQPKRLHPALQIAEGMRGDAETAVEEMTASIGVMLDRAGDLGEFREMLRNAYGDLDSAKLAEAMAGGIAAAHAAGASDLVDESGS